MTDGETIYASLILPESRPLEGKRCLDAAYRVLARRDPRRDGKPFRNPQRGTVQGGRLCIAVMFEETGEYGPQVRITITDKEGGAADPEAAATVLADVVLDALSRCPADFIEWMEPGTLVDRDEFLDLRSYVSPRRPEALTEDPDQLVPEVVLASEKAVADRLPDWVGSVVNASAPEKPSQSRSRTLSWAAAALVATVSLPAAALLLLFGLLLGRRGSQADSQAELRAGSRADIADTAADIAPEQPGSSRARALSWAVTPLVALVSLPAGAMMLLFGLLRGRRGSQA